MPSETNLEQQIAQEFRYEAESERECRNCGHAFPHDVGAGSLQYCRGYQCDSECTESDRLIADLRHALAEERAKVADAERAVEIVQLRARIERDYVAKDAVEAEYWRCLHCDAVYALRDRAKAIEHFGKSSGDTPKCLAVDPAPKEPETTCNHKFRDLMHPPGHCPDHPAVDPTGLDTVNALTGERSHRLGVDETLRESEAMHHLWMILSAAWAYDDKPHQLYSAIRAAAIAFEDDPDYSAEIVRLMDIEYMRDRRRPSPSSPSDDRKERLAAAREILLAMHLYPNYRLDSRGPRGCLYDAVKLLAPDMAASVEQCGWDDTFNKYFDEDGDPRDPSPSDREPVRASGGSDVLR